MPKLNPRARRLSWRKRLEPFAQMYWKFMSDMEVRVRGTKASELRALVRATMMPTATNCWYTTYRVAPLLREAIMQERYSRRSRRRKA